MPSQLRDQVTHRFFDRAVGDIKDDVGDRAVDRVALREHLADFVGGVGAAGQRGALVGGRRVAGDAPGEDVGVAAQVDAFDVVGLLDALLCAGVGQGAAAQRDDLVVFLE